jgi:hypothetical protein
MLNQCEFDAVRKVASEIAGKFDAAIVIALLSQKLLMLHQRLFAPGDGGDGGSVTTEDGAQLSTVVTIIRAVRAILFALCNVLMIHTTKALALIADWPIQDTMLALLTDIRLSAIAEQGMCSRCDRETCTWLIEVVALCRGSAKAATWLHRCFVIDHQGRVTASVVQQ